MLLKILMLFLRRKSPKLKASGFNVLDKIDLEPYEKDHLTFICEFGF